MIAGMGLGNRNRRRRSTFLFASFSFVSVCGYVDNCTLLLLVFPASRCGMNKKGGGAVSDQGPCEARPKDTARLPSIVVAIEDRRLSRVKARIA